MTGLVSQVCLAQGPLAMLKPSDPTSAGGSVASGGAANSANGTGTAKTAEPISAPEPGSREPVTVGTRKMVTTTVRVNAAADATDTNEAMSAGSARRRSN